MTSGQGRRGIALGFSVCVSLLTAAVAPAGAVSPSPPPPLLAFSESAASGTRPLLATHLGRHVLGDSRAERRARPLHGAGIPAPLEGRPDEPGPPAPGRPLPGGRQLRCDDRLWATFWNGSALDGGRRHGGHDPAPARGERRRRCGRTTGSSTPRSSRRAGSSSSCPASTRTRRPCTGRTPGRPGPPSTMTPWSNTSPAGVFDWVRLAARPGTNQIAFVGIANEVSASPGSFAVHGGDLERRHEHLGREAGPELPRRPGRGLTRPRRSTWRSPCAATTPARRWRSGARATRSSRASGTRPRAGARRPPSRPTAPAPPCAGCVSPPTPRATISSSPSATWTGRPGASRPCPTTAAPAPGERSRPSTRRARSATSPVTAPSTSPGTRSSARATCSSPTRTAPGCGPPTRRTAG